MNIALIEQYGNNCRCVYIGQVLEMLSQERSMKNQDQPKATVLLREILALGEHQVEQGKVRSAADVVRRIRQRRR